MPLRSKLSPRALALYLALIAGLWLLAWLGFDRDPFWSLLAAAGLVELSSRLVEWWTRRKSAATRGRN